MKLQASNSCICKGDFLGGEIEPGTFHLECPVSPDGLISGQEVQEEKDSICAPAFESRENASCIDLDG